MNDLPWPTPEECKWVCNSLSERNPEIFNLKTQENPNGKLTPEALTEALIHVWIAQRASKFICKK